MGPDAVRANLQNTILTLYDDGIKPLQNYVKGRLKERESSAGLVKNCVELCSKFPDLFQVTRSSQGQNGEEVTIFLASPPASFAGWVDVDSPDDPYDEAMWEEFKKFLEAQKGFAGGRYGMARELKQQALPFLQSYSLGKVCHIVQLSIQSRKLLVYHRKMLRPVAALDAAVSGDTAQEAIKDIDELCILVMGELKKRPDGIPLCRLKQDLKHTYSRTLLEMNFQCTKLAELFTKEPLNSAFLLESQSEGNSVMIRMGRTETYSEKLRMLLSRA